MIVAYFFLGILCVAGAALLFKTYHEGQDRFIADALQSQQIEGEIANRRPTNKAPQQARVIAWSVGASVVALLQLLFSGGGFRLNPALLLIGAVMGEISWQSRMQRAKKRLIRQIEFYLPTVMERVVMAVGAGFDIVPAMIEAARGGDDPVSRIMNRAAGFMNAGLGLEDSLKTAAGEVECSALKHVCVHLSLAHRQGGELVRPLRELGDATQAYYQETVEEEIAKLPVKAVIPLVLTFAGLIVCFLTIPLIQLGSITSKVAHVAQ